MLKLGRDSDMLFPVFGHVQKWIREPRAFRTILSKPPTASILFRLAALGLPLAIAAGLPPARAS